MTVIVIVVVTLPPVLVALTVYVVVALTTVGVPDISPVAVSKTRPAGSAGVIVQDTTGPPVVIGVSACIAVLLVRVYGVLA